MPDIEQPLAILVEWPWLALIPALAFFAFSRRSRRGIVVITAISWLLYCAYEYGMRLRLLCSGECNIRVDLLLIYPYLFAMSVAAVVVGRKRVSNGEREAAVSAAARGARPANSKFSRRVAPSAHRTVAPS